MKRLLLLISTVCVCLFFISNCKKDPSLFNENTNVDTSTVTKPKLVVLIIDGPRWEETWGDTSHQYQPCLNDSLRQEGCLFTQFYNMGVTLTVPGHIAISTGNYENAANNGTQLPQQPGLVQLYKKRYNSDSTKVWLIASKDKLEVLNNCLNTSWNGLYKCSTDCGVNGLGTGYREDSVTFNHAKNVLSSDHPDMLFVQFKEPDVSGHSNNWPGYLNGIATGDRYAWEIWKILQSDNYYKNKTTFVITNDHGRHTNGILDGFISHGDNCIGCRHINLFIAGPAIKKNQQINNVYEQIDLNRTLCNLFKLDSTYSQGRVMHEIKN